MFGQVLGLNTILFHRGMLEMLMRYVIVRFMSLGIFCCTCMEDFDVLSRFTGTGLVFLINLNTGLFGFAETLAKYD